MLREGHVYRIAEHEQEEWTASCEGGIWEWVTTERQPPMLGWDSTCNETRSDWTPYARLSSPVATVSPRVSHLTTLPPSAAQ